MNRSLRTGITALAGAVVLGTAGVAIAGAAGADDRDQQAAKREDTATAWVTPAADDDPDGTDGARDRADGPTHHTTVTSPTRNTAPTRNTGPTKNTGPTNASDHRGSGR